jgi:hypothetical protein
VEKVEKIFQLILVFSSPIYGSSIDDLVKFREGNTGFLKIKRFNGMQLLPFDDSTCHSSNDCKATFIAGDSRVNLFFGLTSTHILFTREHNRYENHTLTQPYVL